MQYPIVFDKFDTDFTTHGLAVLEKAKDVKIRKAINSDYKLTFSLPMTDEKWQYLQAENFVLVEDQLFRIRNMEEHRTPEGILTSSVDCEHVWYDTNDCKYIPYFRMIGKTPREILEAAYSGTRFHIGDVQINTPTDIEMSKTNPARITQELVRLVGGELLRDNWNLSLVQRVGNNNGVQIRVGKNCKEVKRTTDSTTLVTRLYPYGKDDLDISTANSGVPYLDSVLKDNYDYIHSNTKEYRDITNPSELKTEALKEFSTDEKDGIDKPKVTYETTVIELKKLAEYGEFESFSLGDTVRVIDEYLGIDINARVMEYEYYPIEAKSSTVVLQNFRSNLAKVLADLIRNKNAFDKITDSKGNVKADYVEYLIGKLSTEINAAIGSKKVVVHDYGDIWVDNIQNPTKAMAIVNGMFAIANSKKANGDWNWRVVGTGDALVADQVVANWVYAGKVTAQQIDVSGGKITADQIDANQLRVKAANIDGKLQAIQIETGQLVVGDNIILGPNATISWGRVTNQPYIHDVNSITQITNDTVKTTNVIAQNLKVKSANIDGPVTAQVVNSDTDARIGRYLYITDPVNGGIKFNGVDALYYDPMSFVITAAGKALNLYGSLLRFNDTLVSLQGHAHSEYSPTSHTHPQYCTAQVFNGFIEFFQGGLYLGKSKLE